MNHSTIVPIFNSGKYELISKHRPISSLFTLSQDFESLVYQVFKIPWNNITGKQYGFLKMYLVLVRKTKAKHTHTPQVLVLTYPSGIWSIITFYNLFIDNFVYLCYASNLKFYYSLNIHITYKLSWNFTN